MANKIDQEIVVSALNNILRYCIVITEILNSGNQSNLEKFLICLITANDIAEAIELINGIFKDSFNDL